VYDSVHAANPGLPVFEVPNFGPLTERPVKPAPQGTPVIGTLGRLHVNKGLDVMLRALTLLPDVRLRIAGDGPELGSLQALAAELGVTDRVDFCGWVEAADYLHGLDLFVLPSRVEPFGLVVTEAMAAGVPVVATKIDGPREILLDGQFGAVCANEDPNALADAIRAVIADWPAALKRAVAAQHYALTHFSLEAGARRLSAVVGEIAQKT
jgi:glycosyltransferase involved in cell wall biosynthesis